MREFRQTETIAAIATAMAPSGIGIIRISGEDAVSIAEKIFDPKQPGKRLSEQKSHTIHYGYIKDGETVVDEVLLLLMRAPNTYTREDTIEIDTHGGVLVMQRILETVLKYGARPAEPGEYTKRAFLNGRIDLTQAESVIDVIQAKNDNALKSSVSQLRGVLSEKIRKIRETLLYELAFIESAIDDPEHYSLDDYPPVLKSKMDQIRNTLQEMIRKADDGRILKEGIQTVIAGKPNAGKSSLLNALLGEDRAIVTEIAGTTRDVLSEQIQLDGIGLHIMDTAGIHDTEDVVEQIGVQRSKDAMEEADLVLFVADAASGLDENDRLILSEIKEKKAIVLLNKTDLEMKIQKADLEKLTDHPVLSVSMKEKTGLSELTETIRSMFFAGQLQFNDEVYISNLRQKNALINAEKSIGQVLESLKNQMPEDFLTIDMMDAYEELGYIIGESVEDDLVDKIFSEFCMGK